MRSNYDKRDTLRPVRVSRSVAAAFVARYHRHHKPDQGDRFCLGAWSDALGRLCGVAVVGRPRAKALSQDAGVEVTRLCTDGTKNACSFLYSAAAEVSRLMGFAWIITYTLPSEGGASLRALGWWPEEGCGGPSSAWAASRPREIATDLGPKVRWLKLLNEWRDVEQPVVEEPQESFGW